MPDQSNFMGVFRGVENPGDHRSTVKRNRQPVSCSACRARKLKCSRHHPCEACVKRCEGSTCEFKSSAANSFPVAVTKSRGKGARARNEAQARLQSLEDMVSKFIQSGAPPLSASASSSNISQSSEPQDESANRQIYPVSKAEPADRLSKEGNEMIYVGASHWATILENIKGIHDVLESDDEFEESFTEPIPSSTDFFLGRLESITMADALALIPPRPIADGLMSVYFNAANFIAASWLHTTRFRREYETFWTDPQSVSFMWLSSLFSVLSVAAELATARRQEIAGFSPDIFSPSMFRTRAGQCLVTGDYLRPQPYAVESLLLYFYCSLFQSSNEQDRSWSILCITARLAQRMGYHRDPKYLPPSDNITPFEGEMRRRVWMFIDSFDVMQSLKLGLPSLIHEAECDSEPPRNLWDEDFDESSGALPPSRPYTETTPMLFPCYKTRYIRLLRRISRLTMATQRPSYKEVVKIDEELQLIHEEVPPVLKARPIKTTSFSDEANMITKRLVAETIYLKSLCILHRIYLTYDRANPQFEPSRRACKEAALQILNIQIETYKECLPGGRLYEEKWTIFSSTLYDFLLAATVVCLDVYEGEPSSPDRARKIAVLRESYNSWAKWRHIAKEAVHAEKVVGSMLRNISVLEPQHSISSVPALPSVPVAFVGDSEDSETLDDLLRVSKSLDTSIDTWPFDNVFDDTDNFDWNMIDTYLR